MKKNVLAVIFSAALAIASLAGCGKDSAETVENSAQEASQADENTEEVTEEKTAPGDGNGIQDEAGDIDISYQEETESRNEENIAPDAETSGTEEVTVRVGSLKGPTSMGLVYLMEQAEKGEAANNYEFTMAASADELLPAMISGDLDIVLIPANVASVLYMKTEGGVSVIDINTLGVLYMVSGDSGIKGMDDLKGRTLYLTGKGTTPDYVLQYLLRENGLTTQDVTLEYKSEATEVAAILAKTPDAIGVLPQPFVTAACAQNEELSVVMDLTEQWNAVQKESGSRLVTGVTVVRNSFLEEYQDTVERFMEEHKASAAYANEHVEEAAELVAAAGIIEKAPTAVEAMPACNITYMDGDDMKMALSGYLEVLFGQDAASVGGGLPGDEFYYIP